MHYHAEIIMPPTDDVEVAIEKYMRDFSENNEDSRNGFWDWYQIGGRYSGAKVEALCDSKKMEEFYEELKSAKVTVSGLVWGKQELSPADQQDFVDAMWLRYFPDSPIRHAPMFKHSGQEVAPMDICKVSEIPVGLTAYTVMICGKESAENLFHKAIWNGCTHQNSDWNGGVLDALTVHAKKLESYREEWREKNTVKPDWLCVTVDYHS